MADEAQGHADIINMNNTISDFFINVEWKAFLNFSLVWSDKIGVIKWSALEGRHSDFEIVIKDRIRSKVEGRDVEIRERRAVVKSSHSKVKREIQSLNDFSGEVWDKMDDVLLSEYNKWSGKDLTLTLKLKVVIIIDKRPHIFVNSSPLFSEISSPSYKRERKTRTVDLRGQN